MEFTYGSYTELLATAAKNDYRFCLYHDADRFDRTVILRHDIDFSPEKALEMADLEQQQGIRSTYFVLLATEFYNVFSRKTDRVLRQILAMGHEIGLHFDEARYESTGHGALHEHVDKEAEILQTALSAPVRVVSMHRPGQNSSTGNLVFPKRINAYSPPFMQDMKYVSDSRMHWREDVVSIVQSGEHARLHILTHPFWYSETPESTSIKLQRLIDGARRRTYENLQDNFRDIQEFVSAEDLD